MLSSALNTKHVQTCNIVLFIQYSYLFVLLKKKTPVSLSKLEKQI